jgi:hypothetical protein
MSHVRKCHLVPEGERSKHLRKWLRRRYWHRHRREERREICRLYREYSDAN